MATGKCLKCDKIAEMTTDHIIPQWFSKLLPSFGLAPLEFNTQYVCKECNQTKGDKIQYEDPLSRDLVKQIVVKFLKCIREHEEFNP